MLRRQSRATTGPEATDRTIGDSYTIASYRRALTRACKIAGVESWTPHRLRYNAETHLRRQ